MRSLLALDADRSEITADPATVSNPQCVSVWAPAQPASFDGDTSVDRDTVTGTVVQSLRALTAQPWQDSVIQAAVTVQEQPARFVLRQQRRWAACAAGGPVTITTTGSAPQSWTVDPPTTAAGIVTMTLTGAEGGRCQCGVAARGNVIFDVRQCRSDGAGDVAAIIRALEQRIPN